MKMQFYNTKRIWTDRETYDLLEMMLTMCELMTRETGEILTLRDMITIVMNNWQNKIRNGYKIDKNIVCKDRIHYLTMNIREDIWNRFERVCKDEKISLENGFKMAMLEYDFS